MTTKGDGADDPPDDGATVAPIPLPPDPFGRWLDTTDDTDPEPSDEDEPACP